VPLPATEMSHFPLTAVSDLRYCPHRPTSNCSSVLGHGLIVSKKRTCVGCATRVERRVFRLTSHGFLARKTQALSDGEHCGFIARASGDLYGPFFCWEGEGRPTQLVVERRVPKQPKTGQEFISLVIGDGCLEKWCFSIEQGTDQHIGSFYCLKEPPPPRLHVLPGALDVVEG
jgi:hypothetical protein